MTSALESAAHLYLAQRLVARDQPDLTDPEVAWGRCVIESDLMRAWAEEHGLAEGLRLIRVTGQNYPGREHWAIVDFDEEHPEDSPVVDITARQFSADAPLPWSGTLLDWYDDVCDWMNDWIHVEVRDPHVVAPMQGERYEDGLVFDDEYGRDDHEPGDLTYPWQRTQEQA